MEHERTWWSEDFYHVCVCVCDMTDALMIKTCITRMRSPTPLRPSQTDSEASAVWYNHLKKSNTNSSILNTQDSFSAVQSSMTSHPAVHPLQISYFHCTDVKRSDKRPDRLKPPSLRLRRNSSRQMSSSSHLEVLLNHLHSSDSQSSIAEAAVNVNTLTGLRFRIYSWDRA